MNRITSSEGSASVRWAALVVALALAGEAGAAPATRFEPEMQVQGTPLLLNGAGTRYKAIFKVYDAALYVPRKVSTTEELLALPGLKRLQFMALRDMPSAEIGRLFVRGMMENSPSETAQMQAVSIARLIEVFSARSKILAGESFALQYVPGKGTTFEVAGKPQTAPFGDAEFFAMTLKIWFGASPADLMLKQALLGAPDTRFDQR